MNIDQKKLLSDLAKKIENQPRERGRIIASLTSARILTKKETFSKYYSHLAKVSTFSK